MGWQDELRHQVCDTDGDRLAFWPYVYTRHIVGTTKRVAEALVNQVYAINETEVSGIAPGHLLLEHSFVDEDGPWLEFLVRDAHSLPWNRTGTGATAVGNPEDGTLRIHFPELLNDQGQPRYRRFKFAEVVESWRDLPSFL